MQVGWIDFSQQERERTLTILSSLQEPGSIDELGVGIVRDAFAGRFFPGTSTLLTKARYFFLTPYLMMSMERGRDKVRQTPRALRDQYQNLERKCAEGLLECEKDREGIIGRVSLSQGKWVSRGPGELYWAPLRRLGFMRSYAAESYKDYFGHLSQIRVRADNQLAALPDGYDDGLSDDREPNASAWNIPRECFADWSKEWSDWDQKAAMALTKDEAVFLKNQILKAQSESLFASLLENENLRLIALSSSSDDDYFATGESAFHGFLEQGGLQAIRLKSEEMAHLCSVADQFSEFVLGCRIAYNMQIAGQEESSQEAWEQFEPRAPEVASSLDIDEVGIVLGISSQGGFQSLRSFVMQARSAMDDGNLNELKDVVRAREKYLKGARAKIGRTDLGDFGWRGGRRLPYRFNYAMNIVREIQEAGGFDA